MKKIVLTFLTMCSIILLYSFTNIVEERTTISSIEIVDDVEVEIYYYQESEFRLVLEEKISSMNENPEKQKILVRKGEEEGVYGLSEPILSNNDDDVERCGDCGPTVDEVMHQLNSDPCWWLVDFSNHIWGWDNGC